MGKRKRLYSYYKNAEERKKMHNKVKARRTKRIIISYESLPEKEKIKIRKYQTNYYNRNKDNPEFKKKLKEATSKWQKKNPEKLREYNRRHYQKNREEIMRKRKEYRKKKKGEINE